MNIVAHQIYVLIAQHHSVREPMSYGTCCAPVDFEWMVADLREMGFAPEYAVRTEPDGRTYCDVRLAKPEAAMSRFFEKYPLLRAYVDTKM